jgi:crotonobetainyl-CoA:carnitine CoA-transferase CaiB-like acyl-CoA transferase
LLADLGATVLKIERPGTGDDTRAWGPPFLQDRDGNDTGEAAYYLACNRGKQSLAIDFTKPDGRDLVLALAAQSDALIENFKVGGLAKYGLHYEALSAEYPALVYCSISGFGQQGPLAGEGAYDLSIQALSGILSLTGHPEQPVAKVPVAALDFGSALYGVIGILSALRQREQTGRGQWVQTSLLETALAWLSMHIASYLGGGDEPTRQGTRSPFFAPYEAYQTADGQLVVVGTGGDSGWHSFCRALELPELADDPRFATNSSRVANAEALREAVEAVMTTRPTEHWVQRMHAERVPYAPVQTLPEVLRSEQVAALGAISRLTHRVAGEIPIVRLPLTMSGAHVTATDPPPALDGDGDLGFRTA